MPDLDFIRETYASLPLEKLILIAREGTNDMAPGAFEALEKEFRKRLLDINDYLPIPEPEELLEEPIPGFVNQKSGADDAMLGNSYQTLMYPGDPEKENNEKQAALEGLSALTNKELERLIIRANWIIFLFMTLFAIGILITVESLIKPVEEGGPIFAYGAIFTGLIGAFAAWNRKRIYRNQLTRFDFEKEKPGDEK